MNEHDRQEAEAAINAAYDAMTDLMDIADDYDLTNLVAEAERIQTEINALTRRLP